MRMGLSAATKGKNNHVPSVGINSTKRVITNKFPHNKLGTETGQNDKKQFGSKHLLLIRTGYFFVILASSAPLVSIFAAASR